MLARSSFPILLILGSLSSARAQESLFEEVGNDRLKVRYLSSEIEADDANGLLVNFRSAREQFQEVLQFDPVEGNLTITVRVRPGLNHFAYTNGRDQLFVDFTDPNQYRPVRDLDFRIWKIALDAYAQFWTFGILDHMAGLDPRFAESISEYVWYQLQVFGITGIAPEPPSGAGQFWLQVDELFGSEITSWVLNTLDGQKLHASQLGSILRERMIDATEDEDAADLVDMVAPIRDLYSAEVFEPSGPLSPAVTLRMSRASLFNGVRLLDVATEPMSAADRVRDFESAYMTVFRTYPDRDLASSPPKVGDVDLWKLYSEFRGRIELAQDNLDFYLMMREFFARFRDRWVCVVTDQGSPYWQGVQGVSLVDLGGRAVVLQAREDGLPYKSGVRPGMELLTIDGEPAAEVWAGLEQFFRTTFSCSSSQEVRSRALNMMLTGAPDSEVTLTFRDTSGVDHSMAFRRGSPNNLSATPPDAPGTGPKNGGSTNEPAPAVVAAPSPEFIKSELRSDGVAVIKIEVFAPPIVPVYGQLLDEYRKKEIRGLVIDLRGNSAGLLQVSMPALSLLLDSEVTLGEMASRVTSEAPGSVSTQPIVLRPLPTVPGFHGPCAVLVDAWTSGAAELFALGFKMSNRGAVLGASTSGAANLPTERNWPFLTLPSSGIQISLTQSVVLLRDGLPLQGRGVAPTQLVSPTLEDLVAGRDSVLEAAVAQLPH